MLKDDIVSNGYDLFINKHKQNEFVEEEYLHPCEIMAEINALEQEILESHRELWAMLDV